MFKRIRNRLTLLYTGLMILFLITFTALCYFFLSQFLYHDSKQKILQLAHKEMEEHTKDFIEWEDREKSETHEDSFEPRFSRSFYILVSKDGQIIKADAPSSLLERSNLKKILQWEPKRIEVRFESLNVEPNTIHVILAANPVYFQGNYLGTVYSGTDISEQKHVLDRLVWILIGLSVFFVGLSSLMSYFMAERAMTPIISAFRRQQEFVADASHELRTPLSVIHSSLEVLDAEEKEHLSAFSQQVLDDLQEEVQRMAKLLSDLLTLARIDSGVMEVSLQNMAIKELLDSLLRSFHHLAGKKNIQLNLIMERNFQIYADPERIRQLFYILMDNALRYTPEGGTITVLAEPTRGKGNSLRIEVTDTGIGIDPDQQKRIFDRFYRTDKARSREHGGTGLGLSIAQWIVEVHGGTIEVDSTLGKGTTFIMHLPILNEKERERS